MPIKHFFLLMLENRSFDHLFGFSPIKGTDAITGQPTSIDQPDPAVNRNTDDATGSVYPVREGADFSLKGLDKDPAHEFGDVQQQLTGPNLGFVNSYAAQGAAEAGRVMDCFPADQLPVLNQLATTFAICDRWFSSLPGPTWPNRFFMMAASSGGLTKSPGTGDIIKATALEGYDFEHGNIFDALDRKSIPWCIVEGDLFPISFALKGMDKNAAKGRFIDIGNFSAKLKDPAFSENFVLIEPQYGSHKFDVTGPGDFSGGNSMHPLDDVRKGEQLVKQVYESIRAVPTVWNQSVLLITFDEHGGFYDHALTPSVTPPGDRPINAAPGQAPFDFAQAGVRVPAIIVSPLIGKGSIDHTEYDHTSALASLERLFHIEPLTQRDARAKDFLHLFRIDPPRTDTPVLLKEPALHVPAAPLVSEPEDTLESLKADLASLDPGTITTPLSKTAGMDISGPQAGFAYVGLLRALSRTEDEQERASWKKEFQQINTSIDAARFMTRAKLKVHFNEYIPYFR